MVNWMGGFLGSRRESPESDSALVAALPPAEPPLAHSQDLDIIFLRWLFSGFPPPDIRNQALEKSVLYALKRKTESEAFDVHLVPRKPSVLPDLMKSLHDRNASGKQLARQIGRDATLIAEVIREANSPYYHPVDRISNLDKAVMLLGNRGMRMVVAKSYLRPVINTDTSALARNIAPRLWEQSERCAMACCILSDAFRVDPFDAFLAGLLKNLGMTVALRVISQVFNGEQLPNQTDFCVQVDAYAKKLAISIAEIWEMPQAITQAMIELGQPELSASERTPMGKALYVGNRLSELALMVEHGCVAGTLLENAGLSDLEMNCYQKIRQVKAVQD